MYVANNNNYGIQGQDSITVIDLQSHKVISTIHDPSFQQPYAIASNKYSVYVMNSNSSTISILHPYFHRVMGVIQGLDGPSGMVISKDGKIGYVNNYGGPGGKESGNGNTVSIVDLSKNIVIGEITVGLAPADLAMSPNGKKIYVRQNNAYYNKVFLIKCLSIEIYASKFLFDWT